jgi:hypothetical protein
MKKSYTDFIPRKSLIDKYNPSGRGNLSEREERHLLITMLDTFVKGKAATIISPEESQAIQAGQGI